MTNSCKYSEKTAVNRTSVARSQTKLLMFCGMILLANLLEAQVQHGAYANYGLITVNPFYAGHLVQVRRATDNATANISASCGGLDTAQLTTFLCGKAGYVTTWFDQSNNGRHLTQTVTTKQPQIMITGTPLDQPGWLPDFAYRRSITISNTFVASNLTDFPLLVAFANDASIGSHILDLTNYNDVRFTAADGTTLLKYEKEYMAISSGSATGRYWVKVPTITSSVSTVIYMYYGSSCHTDASDKSNVWDANYNCVWHLGEGTGTVTADSKNNMLGTFMGGSVAPTWTPSGKVGNALSFGGGGYIAISGGSPPSGNALYTMEAWGRITVTTGNRGMVGYGNYGNLNQVNALRSAPECASPGIVNYWWSNDVYACAFGLTVNTWYHFAGRYDGSLRQLFVNGNFQTADAPGVHNFGTANFEIGRTNFTEYWSGILDEIRISSIARSNDWVAFEYQNMNQANNCLTFGTESAATLYSGPPSIYFNGNTYLSNPGILSTQPISTSFVFKTNSLSSPGAELFGWGDNSGPGSRIGCWLDYTTSTQGKLGFENQGGKQLSSSSFSTSVWNIVSQVLSGSSLTGLQQWINGATVTMSTVGSPGSLSIAAGEFVVGTSPTTYSNGFNGYLRELSYYNQSLSDTRRTLIETNQGTYHNLSISNSKYTPPTSTSYVAFVTGVGRQSSTDSVAGTRQTRGMGFSVGTGSSDFLKDNGDYITCGLNCPITGTITSLNVPYMFVQRRSNDWYVDKNDVGSNNGLMTVFFDFNDYGVTGVPGIASNYLLIYRNSPTSLFGIVPNTTVTTTGDQVRFAVDASEILDNYYYTLATTNSLTSPLPIELTTFSGVCEKTGTRFNWTTATEKNNAYFTIEKSEDGVNFSVLANIAGTGNSTSFTYYS